MNSTSGVPSLSAGSGEGGSDPEQAGPDVIRVEDALGFLERLFVVAVVSRYGEPPCLPSLVVDQISPQCFRHDMITGLRHYVKVKTVLFSMNVSINVDSFTPYSPHLREHTQYLGISDPCADNVYVASAFRVRVYMKWVISLKSLFARLSIFSGYPDWSPACKCGTS